MIKKCKYCGREFDARGRELTCGAPGCREKFIEDKKAHRRELEYEKRYLGKDYVPKIVRRTDREFALYAIYDNKDNFRFCGTSQECSDYLGVKNGNFRSMASRCRTGKCKKRKYNIFKIEDEEDK